MNGILLIDKPKGLTSFDVVFKIKKKFNIKKVGHTGTLDPFATGLMIILCGQATKLAFLFNDLDKSYEGRMVFSKLYDTYDVTGKIIGENNSTIINDEKIDDAVKNFPKQYDQMPPIYSAIKINGQKAYDLARNGKEVKLETRNVHIYDFVKKNELINQGFDFMIHVSKGTYIRSIAFDLGSKLETYGALESLRRIKIGEYDINHAKTLEEISDNDLIDEKSLFSHVDKLILSDFEINLVKNGVYLDSRQIETEKAFVVQDKSSKMIAYYEPTEIKYTYKPVYFFNMESK